MRSRQPLDGHQSSDLIETLTLGSSLAGSSCGTIGVPDDGETNVDRALVSIPEAGEALHLGETKVKELVARGELLSVKIGKSRRIPVTAIQAYIDRLVGESCADARIASFTN
jgi:excisionase family DNA binding protein